MHYVKAIPLSLYSRAFYVNVAAVWKGWGLAYLCCVILITLIPVTMMREHKLDSTMQEAGFENYEQLFRYLVDSLPTIEVHNHRVKSDPNQPITVSLPNIERPVMVIDTTNTQQDLQATGAFILINSDKVHVLDPRFGQEELPMHDLLPAMGVEASDEMVIDRELFMQWEEPFVAMMHYVEWIYAISDSVMLFVLFAVRIAVYATIAIMLAQWMKLELSFSVLMRLAAVSATPVLLVQLLEVMSPMQLLAWPRAVYMVVHLAYLFHALDSIKRAGITKIK